MLGSSFESSVWVFRGSAVEIVGVYWTAQIQHVCERAQVHLSRVSEAATRAG